MDEGVIPQRGVRSHLRRPAATPNLAAGWERSLSAPPPWALLAPGNAQVALPISGFASPGPAGSNLVKPGQTTFPSNRPPPVRRPAGYSSSLPQADGALPQQPLRFRANR